MLRAYCSNIFTVVLHIQDWFSSEPVCGWPGKSLKEAAENFVYKIEMYFDLTLAAGGSDIQDVKNFGRLCLVYKLCFLIMQRKITRSWSTFFKENASYSKPALKTRIRFNLI